MATVSVILAIIIIFIILWIMLIAGRTNNENVNEFAVKYAHRGLVTYDYPENSLSAFSNSVEKGVGIELDVHLMSDGKLAVIHDSSLNRTAGEDKNIEELTEEELSQFRLGDTEERIPTFRQVLETVGGRVPLLIELKSAFNNSGVICKTLMKELENYNGPFCIESFDPRCLIWFKNNHPEVVRGQLSQNFIKRKEKLLVSLKVVLTMMILNVASQPDFIAYRFEDRKNFANLVAKNFWKMKAFVWTVKSKDNAEKAEEEGYSIIFENLE